MQRIDQSLPSVFHPGEIAAQDRVGVRERAAVFGPRMVRDHMNAQHRAFYSELPFVVLGTQDASGNPWASVLTGQPGFLATPSDRILKIAALPPAGSPLADALDHGGDIGILGIQPETRRRNRAAGRIGARGKDSFQIEIEQSFGNCPQYIQTRQVSLTAAPSADTTITTDRLDTATQALISRADTLFVATAFRSEVGNPAQGADVSHRGGKPGFVRVLDDHTFLIPDFSGNNLFNTIGNLMMNPRAGFAFADFDKGDLVQMTGTAEVIWDGAERDAFVGAERLIRFTSSLVRRSPGGLGLIAPLQDYAPQLARTGDWAG